MQPALITALLNYSKLLISITGRSLYPQEKGEASFPTLHLHEAPLGCLASPSLQCQQMKRYTGESEGSPAFLVIEMWLVNMY